MDCVTIDADCNPGVGWPTHIKKLKDPTQKPYHARMAKAKDVYFDETKRHFKPLSEVSRQHMSGYTISYKFAFLSEKEVMTLFDDVHPKALKLTPMELICEDGSKEWGYPMKLAGLPLDLILTCRKCKVWKMATTCQTEQFLLPEKQLDPAQGKMVYSWMCQAELQKRKPALKPSGWSHVSSYDDLRDLAKNVIAQREAREQKRAQAAEQGSTTVVD